MKIINMVLISFPTESGIHIYNVPDGVTVPLGAYVSCKGDGETEAIMGVAMSPSFYADVQQMASLWSAPADEDRFRGDIVGRYVVIPFESNTTVATPADEDKVE